MPVVADFLRAAAKEFNFIPQQPRGEIEYKRAYAKVASAAGLAKEQAVRIYGFEAGGDGKYDVQAGLEQPRPGAQAISPRWVTTSGWPPTASSSWRRRAISSSGS